MQFAVAVRCEERLMRLTYRDIRHHDLITEGPDTEILVHYYHTSDVSALRPHHVDKVFHHRLALPRRVRAGGRAPPRATGGGFSRGHQAPPEEGPIRGFGHGQVRWAAAPGVRGAAFGNTSVRK